MSEQQIRILQTTDHRCGYYGDRQSRNLLIDPAAGDQRELYDLTIHAGFRRSGQLIYRPHCRQCSACQATRVLVVEFSPSRSQRRCLKRNADLHWDYQPGQCTDELFDLYKRYVQARHRDGGMDQPKPGDFEQFLLSDWSETLFCCARDSHNTLIGAAVCDRMASGLSAVYSFFDPVPVRRSLGTWLILKQIELAESLALPYLYLGYWLKDHPKMHYKANFRPIEILQEGNWQRYEQPA